MTKELACGYESRRRSVCRIASGWRGGRRNAAALALAIVVTVPAGCGSGGSETPPATPVAPPAGLPPASPLSPSPGPVDAVALAQQRALAAYEGMWAAYDAAGRMPQADPDDPRLAAYAAERALRVLVSGLRRLRERGEVIDGEVELNPRVLKLTPAGIPGEAEIEDCGDSSAWLTVDAATGEVTDQPRGRQMVHATVRDTGGGRWKVVDFAVLEVGSCG